MPDFPLYTWIILAGMLGLLVGSFLNVVIIRLPERMAWSWRTEARDMLGEIAPAANTDPRPPGLVREPSHCMHCQHKLAPWDNIPLFSWILLGGRCRYCKARISIQYPLVELIAGVASALVIWHFGATWAGAAGLVFTWLLVALAGIDFQTRLLPDQLTYPLLWLGLLLALVPMFVHPAQAIVGAAVGYLVLWAVYWLFKLLTGKEGMGYGDFKLLAAMGAWMGPLALVPILLLSSLAGAVVGVAMIALGRRQRGAPMPFGPFIALAGWVWLVAGPTLWTAYSRMAGFA